MSLDFLLSDDVSSGVAPPAEDVELGRYLERRTARLLEFVNARDFSNPELDDYFASLFTAAHDRTTPSTSDKPGVFGRDAYIDFAKALVRQVPEFHLQLIASTFSIDKSKSQAKVWTTLRTTGLPGGPLESVSRHEWQKIRGGRWVLLGYQSLVNLGFNDGLY